MRRSKLFLILSGCAALGCGAAAVPPAPEPVAKTLPKVEPAPLQAPAAVPVGAPAAGGTVSIKGQVVWKGAVPQLVPVDVTTDKATCCKDGPLMPNDVEVDPKTKGLKNVLVWVRPDTEDRKDTFPKDKIAPALATAKPVKHVIDQPKCQFEPRVLAARAGDTLEVKNSAGIPHNVSFTSDIESMNPLLPPGGSVTLKNPLAAQNTPIPFSCSIHPWMMGRIRVFDHPYFATTDKDGNFEIKDLPPGKWRLVYWHEKGFHLGKNGILGFPEQIALPANGGTMELKPLEFEIVVPK